MKSAILTLLVLSIGCNIVSAQSPVNTEEYQIYASLLENINKENYENYGRNTYFVILEKTLTLRDLDDDEREILDSFSVKIQTMTDDFKYQNALPSLLLKQFPISFSYALENKSEIEKIVDESVEEGKNAFEIARQKNSEVMEGPPNWGLFYQKYDGAAGYYSFSRVGFSRNKRNACVIVKKDDNWNGFTRFLHFRRVNGKWIEGNGIFREWVS